MSEISFDEQDMQFDNLHTLENFLDRENYKKELNTILISNNKKRKQK